MRKISLSKGIDVISTMIFSGFSFNLPHSEHGFNIGDLKDFLDSAAKGYLVPEVLLTRAILDIVQPKQAKVDKSPYKENWIDQLKGN